MIGSIGFPEVIMIFLVVMLLFGPKKLPGFAKTFGKALKEFRKTINDAKSTIEEEIEKADIGEELKEIKGIKQDIQSIARFDVEEYTKFDDESEKDKEKDKEIESDNNSDKSSGNSNNTTDPYEQMDSEHKDSEQKDSNEHDGEDEEKHK